MVHILLSKNTFTALAVFALLTSSTHSLPQQRSADCPKTNPLVGFSAPITKVSSSSLSGRLTILNDCAMIVSDFTFVQPVLVTAGNTRVFTTETLEPGLSSPQVFVLQQGITWSNIRQLTFSLNNIIVGRVIFDTPAATSTLPIITTTTAAIAVPTAATTVPPVAVPVASPAVVAANSRLVAPSVMFVAIGPQVRGTPNPLNISLYINNIESPTLSLVRGTKYTFVVVAGLIHPFYLTSSSEGAKGKRPESNETVIVGNSKSFGTAAAPFQLEFTPDSTHPNKFFYQCWNHVLMGAPIYLDDGNNTGISNTTFSNVLSASSPLYSFNSFALTLILLASVLAF